MTPRIAIILPVYNAEPYITAAINSLLTQTFPDFELHIIDDGSTDNSLHLITRAAVNDPRIKLLSQPNRGLIPTLNTAIDRILGRGVAGVEYIARMDADDFSLPTRLEKQIAALDANPDISLCGTQIQTFDGTPNPGKTSHHPLTPELIKSTALFRNPLAHPTLLMRSSLFTNGLRYDPAYLHTEDYALWSQLLPTHSFMNLPEVLLHYRLHHTQVSALHQPQQFTTADRIRNQMLQHYGLNPTPRELQLHSALSNDLIPNSDLLEANTWLESLLQKNQQLKIFSPDALATTLTGRFVKLAKLARAAKIPFPETTSPFAPYVHPHTLDPIP